MLPNSNKGTSKELEKQLNLDMLAYFRICRNRQLLWKKRKSGTYSTKSCHEQPNQRLRQPHSSTFSPLGEMRDSKFSNTIMWLAHPLPCHQIFSGIKSVTKQQRWTVFALISRVIFWPPSYFLFLFILKKQVLVVTSYAGERSKMYYT